MFTGSINIRLVLFLIVNFGCHKSTVNEQPQRADIDDDSSVSQVSEKIWGPTAARLKIVVKNRASCGHENPIDLRTEDLSEDALKFLDKIEAQNTESKKCYKFPRIKITVFRDVGEKSYDSHECSNTMVKFEAAKKLIRLVHFEDMKSGYSSDHKNNIYHNNIRIDKADFSTFKVLSKNGDSAEYAKDSIHVYRGGKILKDRDAKTFKVYGFWYTRDKNYIYYNDKIMNGVDKDSFTYIDNHYARDSQNIFFLGKVMEGVDKNSFQVVCRDSDLVASSVLLEPSSLLCSSVYNEDTVCDAVDNNGLIKF